MAVAMDAMAVAIHIKYALNQKRYLTSYSREILSDAQFVESRHCAEHLPTSLLSI